MYQPFVDDASGNGTTIFAMNGYGLFGINPVHRNDGKTILTTTRSHSSPQVDKCIELIKPDEVIKIGGAGYKVLLVLQGRTAT
jgi:3'(2'), 5'-bisphosphate nucleotidase